MITCFRLAILCAVILLTILACSDNPADSKAPGTFLDFVHFDGPEYIWLKYAQSDQSFPGEWVLNWETSLGEPFTDVDGNGRYDPGIDLHYSCDCPLNQDLNHNGLYDAPGGPWSPGLPFDDIDGDSVFRDNPGDFHYYEAGLPFCDFDGNGIHDAVLPHSYVMLQRRHTMLTAAEELVEFYRLDQYYSFTSDSGMTYLLPESLGPALRAPVWFRRDSTGIQVHPDYLPEAVLLPLVGSGSVASADDTLVYPTSGPDTVYLFRRVITPGTSLTISGVTHRDLLKVTFLRVSPPSLGHDYDYYFSKALGPLAIRIYSGEHGLEDWQYFDIRFSQIPLSLTR
jgi:hypothetical protein